MGQQDGRDKRVSAAQRAKNANTIYIDGTLDGNGPDGSQAFPFKTWAQATAALPDPLGTQEDVLAVKRILAAPGTYDEDIDINVAGRQVLLGSWGPGNWKLGVFGGSFGNPTGTPRNVNITGTYTSLDNVAPALYIVSPNPAAQTLTLGDPAQRISGGIIDTTNITGAALRMYIEVKTGAGIDLNSGTGVEIRVQGSHIAGAVTGAGTLVAFDTQFNSTLELLALGTAIHCHFVGDIDVQFSAAGGGTAAGMIGCLYGSMTWTGPAGSFHVDYYSNGRAKAAGVTLAGGATTTLIGDTVALA